MSTSVLCVLEEIQWQRRSVCTSVEAYPNIHYVAYACIEQTVLISHHQNVQTLCTKPIGERGAGSITGLVMLQHIWHLGVEMDSCCSPDSVPAAVDSAWVLVLLSKMGLTQYLLFISLWTSVPNAPQCPQGFIGIVTALICIFNYFTSSQHSNQHFPALAVILYLSEFCSTPWIQALFLCFIPVVFC